MIKKFPSIVLFLFFSETFLFAKSNFFQEGVSLFEINKKAKFVKITKAGFYESMVHSVEMTQKTINYKL